MRILAYFEGGYMDGRLEVLPEALPEWRVAALPRPGESLGRNDDPRPRESMVYRREGRRTANAPTGEPVFRYVLVEQRGD